MTGSIETSPVRKTLLAAYGNAVIARIMIVRDMLIVRLRNDGIKSILSSLNCCISTIIGETLPVRLYVYANALDESNYMQPASCAVRD